MRPRHLRPQLVTVRPMIDKASSANVFGDAPIVASDNRESSFQVLMTISWNRNEFTNGALGRQNKKSATAILWKRDLLKPNKSDYVPGQHDLIQLSTSSLFVTSVEPIGQRPVRLGSSSGGFDGWRLTLSDSNPDQRAATSYDT